MTQPLIALVPLTRLHCHDGIASHLASLLPRLKASGVKIHAACGFIGTPPGSEKTLQTITDACETFNVDERLLVQGKRLTPIALFKQIRALRTLAATANISLWSSHYVIHMQGRALGPAVRIATRNRPVLVFTSQLSVTSSSNLKPTWKTRIKAWSVADRAIAISREIAQELAEVEGHSKANIRIIFHGADMKHFRPPSADEKAHARTQLRIPNGAFTIGIVARIAAVKRHDTLIDAAESMIRQQRNVHLIVAGDGDRTLVDALKKRIQASPLANKSRLLGYADPRAVFWACDVTVLPSEREGFGISVCESMACGVPPLRTPTEGALDQIDDGRTGYLFPVGDSAELTRLLMNIIDNPQQYAGMSLAAAEIAKERFSADVMADKTLSVYRELIEDAAIDPRTRLL